jgi:hypothetical protein
MSLRLFSFLLKLPDYDMVDQIDIVAETVEEAWAFLAINNAKHEWELEGEPRDVVKGLIILHYHPG